MPSDLLGDCLSDFEVCARRAVESILRSPTRMGRLFSPGDRRTGIPIMCQVDSENSDFWVSIGLGVRPEDLPALMGPVADPALRADVAGEIVNTLAGNFLGRKAFAARCGQVPPSLPFFGGKGTIKDEIERFEGIMRINSVEVSFTLAVGGRGRV